MAIEGINGKKILFIGIGFYDYDKLIAEKLRQNGASVCYISSVRKNRLANLFQRFGLKKIATTIIDNNRKKRIDQAARNADIIFTIKGENLNTRDLITLKKRNPDASWILYLWDSVARLENAELLFNFFPTIFSFDRLDCIRDKRLRFRPLFFRDLLDYEGQKDYDLSFIGWVHSDRLQLIRNFKTQLQNCQKRYFFKLYMGPFNYLIQRYIKGSIKKEDNDIITTRAIPYADFSQILSKSKCVLDIAHPLQSGLTMRTLETFTAGCKLLTTNTDIKNYPQINKSYYYILDRTNPRIPDEILFGNAPQTEIKLPRYFHIDTFLSEILNVPS